MLKFRCFSVEFRDKAIAIVDIKSSNVGTS